MTTSRNTNQTVRKTVKKNGLKARKISEREASSHREFWCPGGTSGPNLLIPHGGVELYGSTSWSLTVEAVGPNCMGQMRGTDDSCVVFPLWEIGACTCGCKDA